MKLILEGISASKGTYQGRIKVIRNPVEISDVRDGDVIVLECSSPEYTIALIRARAIITDRGGVLCHAAIVARERGVPCIVGAKDAFKILKNKMEVVVNADKGKIYTP